MEFHNFIFFKFYLFLTCEHTNNFHFHISMCILLQYVLNNPLVNIVVYIVVDNANVKLYLVIDSISYMW